jgi:hypothetical protein
MNLLWQSDFEENIGLDPDVTKSIGVTFTQQGEQNASADPKHH